MSNKQLTIAKQNLASLRVLYNNAIDSHKDIVYYQGNELFVPYLRFMLEYMEAKLKDN